MTLFDSNGHIDFIDYAYSPHYSDNNHGEKYQKHQTQRIVNPDKIKKIKIFGKRIIRQDTNNKVTILRIKK